MTYFEQAVNLAISKGNYNGEHLPFDHDIMFLYQWLESGERPLDAVILDPLFWQALGKALGWYTGHENISLAEYDNKNWKSKAHEYFELKLTGGDEEKFWKELIN